MTGTKVKAIYLLLYMAFATWRVFYNVYLEENGFTGTQIGIVNAIMMATIFLVVPIWGVLADRKGIRPTLLWACLATIVLMFFLGKILMLKFLVFYIFLLTLFHHPLGALTDALAVEYSSINPKYNYGGLRLWGSLGWAVASIIGGFLFMELDTKYIFPVASLFFLGIIPFLALPIKRKVIYKPHFQPLTIDLILKNKQLVTVILLLLLYGIACTPINNFINLYFTQLKASNKVIGYAYALQAISELPFFLLGDRLLKRYGPRTLISLSMSAFFIRMLLYGLFPNIELAITLGVLQGISWSFFLVGIVHHIHELLPKGMHATAQSIIWGIYLGLGQTIGNLGIGYLKDTIGMVKVMLWFSLPIFVLMILFNLYFWKHKTSDSVKQS
ncbi:MAG: MFS transporter [Bacteroidales bacterium]|nr:MFS transporter [Bacteroidales bacterium]